MDDNIYANTLDNDPKPTKNTAHAELKDKKTEKTFISVFGLLLLLGALTTLCAVGFLYHNKEVSYEILSKKNANITATLMLQEHETNVTEKNYEKLNMKYQQAHGRILSSCKESQNDSLCENGWKSFGLKCYYFSNSKLNWTQSRDFCVRKGGHLVVITSQAEQDVVSSQIRETHWIGLNDLETEGKWMWANKQPLQDTFFIKWYVDGQKQPDNWKEEDPAGEDCVAMGYERYYLNKWFDDSCSKQKSFICEN